MISPTENLEAEVIDLLPLPLLAMAQDEADWQYRDARAMLRICRRQIRSALAAKNPAKLNLLLDIYLHAVRRVALLRARVKALRLTHRFLIQHSLETEAAAWASGFSGSQV